MSTSANELSIYKQNRIKELTNAYNSNITKLNNTLKNNLNITQKTRLSNSVKQLQFNTLLNQFNNNIKILKDNYNKNVSIINNFVPNKITITGKKKALLIGINYTGTSNELYGCINDMNSIKERIMQNGFNESDINMLTDNASIKPTKSNILSAFTNLLKGAQPGDFLFFGYSGHGSYSIDRNGDEKTGYDQMIVSLDFNLIVDDDFKKIIDANLKSGVTLFAMFDSCFSGSVLDLRYQFIDSLNYDKYSENLKETETNGDVFMISGCTDKQTSADAFIDNKANGAMTWSLLEALKQKPNCNWRELVKYMRDLLKNNGYSQTPQFSTGNFENIDLPVFI